MFIGVFDSGLGGLSILKQLVRLAPEYDYVYLGDNARAPYGDRSSERIYEFTEQAVRFLFAQGCGLVILACNTASSEALRRLQQEFLPAEYPDRRILGVLIPTAEHIARHFADKKIGIIGTRATIQSDAYVREIKKRATHARIEQRACPLLVPLIEEGWHNTTPARQITRKYLQPFRQKQVNVLVLGCTHYAYIKTMITRMMGKRVTVLDPALLCAKALKRYLAAHPEIEHKLSKKGSGTDSLCETEPDPILLSTDTSDRIKNLVQRYWGGALPIERVQLDH
ncbi:MAG: glutamate racemase [Patescibacteria group bacterium]